MRYSRTIGLLPLALCALALGCTDTNIYINTMEPNIPNKITLSGTVCTDDPAERQFPVRVMFLVDTSGSMSENDPEANRMQAVDDIVHRYWTSANYSFAIIKYAGETVQLTKGYTRNMLELTEAIAALGAVDPCVGGCRDWFSALSLASSVFTGDVLTTNPGSLSRTRYVFIMVANGPPDPSFQGTTCDDRCHGLQAVDQLVEFGAANGAAEVAFHAIQLDNQPGTCDLPSGEVRYCNSDAPCPAECAGTEDCELPARLCSDNHAQTCATNDDCGERCEFLRICNNDANQICIRADECCPRYTCNDPEGANNDYTAGLLQAMAFRGRGEFLRFSIGPQLNFWSLDFDTTQSVFVMKTFMVTNANARTLCGEIYNDSDGDGMSDREELCHGEVLAGTCRNAVECDCLEDVWSQANPAGTDSDPAKADTDGDGLGDLLETMFATVNLDPLRFDKPQACYGLEFPYMDRDADGLNDCEEQVLGTDKSLFDSDRDGLPDLAEFKAGSNHMQPDQLSDSDLDGIRNGDEVIEHLDPLCNDTLARSGEAYRYKIIDEGLRVVPYTSQPRNITGVEAVDVTSRIKAGASTLLYYPVGSLRADGTARDRPTIAWQAPDTGQPGLEVPITGPGTYLLYGACSCVRDCGPCAAGTWCNPNTGVCDPDPCERTHCASTESCDPSSGRCLVDCTKAECEMGQRCDALLGKCLTDRCLNRECPLDQSCDTEAGVCAGEACTGWTCPAGMRLDEAAKPAWLTVRIDEGLLPLSGFFCDGSQGNTSCLTDSDCPANSVCRLRENLIVGLANKNCISFKVKNITLVETLETRAGFGRGYNNLMLYFAQTPLDNPYAYSIFRVALVQMRFVDGVKEPDVAEIPLGDGDFFAIEEK